MFLIIFFALASTFLLGISAAYIISFLQSKGSPYSKRFKEVLPFTILGFTVVLCVVVAGLWLYALKYALPGVRKSFIEAKPYSDCSNLKEGIFENETITLERTGDKQIQTYKKLNKQIIFKIIWIGECEYELIPEAGPQFKTRVKVTSTNSESFTCVVSAEDFGTEYTFKRK